MEHKVAWEQLAEHLVKLTCPINHQRKVSEQQVDSVKISMQHHSLSTPTLTRQRRVEGNKLKYGD